MELKNISYSEFLSIPDDEKVKYIQLLSVSKLANQKINHIGLINPLDYDGKKESLSFWTMKNIQSMDVSIIYNLSWLEYIEEWDSEKLDYLARLDIIQAWQQAAFVSDVLTIIREMEVASLGGSPTPEQIAAGLDEFDKFGAYNQLFELQKVLGCYKLDECKKMPYMEAFTVLSHNSTVHRFEKRLHEILNQKS